MSKYRWLSVVSLVGLPAIGMALAVEDAADNGEARELDDFVEYVEINVSAVPDSSAISTRLPVDADKIPASVGSVSNAMIREQGAEVLSETLWNIAGVNVVGGSGVHDYFVVRGFDSLGNSVVLTDGAQEPEVTYYPMYNVEGVELMKGPTGFLFGPNPLAASVNIVRKQPLPTELGIVDLSLGSFGTLDGKVDWNTASEDGRRAFRVNGLWRESDNYRDDKDSEHSAINPSFFWQVSDDSSLTFNLEYVDAEYSPDSGLPILSSNGTLADVDRERSYQSPFDFSDQQTYRFQVDFETQLTEKIKLRNKTYYRSLDWETTGTLFGGTAPVPGDELLIRSNTFLDDKQDFLGNRFEAAFELSTGRIKHHLVTGIEVLRQEDDFDFGLDRGAFGGGVLPAIGVFNPIETAVAPAPVPFLVGDSTTDIIAPYVIYQGELSRKVQVLAGLRYDDIDTEVDFDVNVQDFGSDFSRDDSELSPMGGVVYSPGNDWNFYANAGRSYAPIGARVANAASLDPEESTQFEIGAKKNFRAGKVQTTLAVYQLDRENIAILDDNGITEQAGDQQSQGVEISVAAEPSPRLRTFFSYAYNDAELEQFSELVVTGPLPTDFVVFDRSGNTPAFAPEHLARFWVSRTFANGLGVAGGGRYFSDQYIAEDNAFEIDAALVLDATVFYDWNDCRLKLHVKNLTDEEYETRGFGTSSVIPANELAVYAGFEYRFQ